RHPMKVFPKFLLLVLLARYTVAQDSGAAPSGRTAIQGIVTKDPSGEPVKKVLVELIAENQKEGGDYTASTGADGEFRIENILPGRYRLFAERTGLLDVDKHHGAGQEVKDLHV